MLRIILSFLLLAAMHASAANPKPKPTPTPPPIVISAVPYTIAAPGTYILAADLVLTVSYSPSDPTSTITPAAITVDTNIVPGTVLLDLKGHTITATGVDSSAIAIGDGVGINAYPITVQNGTLTGFSYGIGTRQGAYSPYLLSGITLANLKLNMVDNADAVSWGIRLYAVNSAVTNCTINNAEDGILDWGIKGNVYSNVTFTNIGIEAFIIGSILNATEVLPSLSFSP